jgi:hypothetical protein
LGSINSFVQEVDQTSREQWEKVLKSELKIEETSKVTSKKTPDGSWNTLSLESKTNSQLSSESTWKKAAQTYIRLPAAFEKCIEEDLNGGVRAFYLEKDFIEQAELDQFLKVLDKFKTPAELEVFLLGDRDLKVGKHPFPVNDEKNMISGRDAFSHGGNNIQELALMSRDLIDHLDGDQKHLNIAVFLGTHLFRNIAKVRAAKLLVRKILNESHSNKTFSLVALTSYREWTLFERYSNILRNDVAVASAFIAGAEHTQSSGYQAIFELEAGLASETEHGDRARRMARNTSHILALESMLGVVGDAAYGSYHLESLTQELCAEAWKLMQKLSLLSKAESREFMLKETTPMREERRKQINTRRLMMAGTNDFADAKDHVGNLTINSRFYRLAQDFEKTRLNVQGLKSIPKVFIALYGDYGALNARVNFVKNYFELIGLTVSDPGESITDKKFFADSLKGHESDVVVLCSSDELYPEIASLVMDLKAKEKFIAGKYELPGFANLFAGQDVLSVLSKLGNSGSGK